MRLVPVFAMILLGSPVAAADHPEIPLWANGAPGSEGKTARKWTKRRTRLTVI